MKSRGLALASIALGVVLPGCPLTDNYYIERAAGGTGQAMFAGTSGLDATGGVLGAAGNGDGVGGDASSGGVPATDTGGTGAVMGDAGAPNATGGDTAVGGAGGTSSVGGTAGTGGETGSAGAGAANAGNGGGTAAGAGGKAASGGREAAGGRPGMGGRAGPGGRSAAGGAPATGGALAGGGMSAAAGAGGRGQFQPLCDDSIVKGSACDQSSPRLCYRACGPDSTGFKSETCQQGTYQEQSGCTFPTGGDYSCYSIPPHLPAECPAATVPRASQPCQLAECIVCFGGSANNPLYEDSTGAQKNGYCVCTNAGTWTCGSTSAWPCPDGDGCN